MRWTWPAMPAGLNKLWDRYKYMLLIVLAGLLLLMLPSGRSEKKATHEGARMEFGFDVEAMEHKLAHTLSQIQGAGEVSVLLTLRESERQVLAQDVRTSERDQNTTAVIVSQGSGMEQPVRIQSLYPRYQGALVVCDGGGDPSVRLELLAAVRALTGLSTEKISICQRQ